MHKVDRSVMEQELKEVSEQIPSPSCSPVSPAAPRNWDHPAKAEKLPEPPSSPFIHIERPGKLLKACLINSYFQ